MWFCLLISIVDVRLWTFSVTHQADAVQSYISKMARLISFSGRHSGDLRFSDISRGYKKRLVT